MIGVCEESGFTCAIFRRYVGARYKVMVDKETYQEMYRTGMNMRYPDKPWDKSFKESDDIEPTTEEYTSWIAEIGKRSALLRKAGLL